MEWLEKYYIALPNLKRGLTYTMGEIIKKIQTLSHASGVKDNMIFDGDMKRGGGEKDVGSF